MQLQRVWLAHDDGVETYGNWCVRMPAGGERYASPKVAASPAQAGLRM